MSQVGNLWTDGVSNQMASPHSLMHAIHVLVVDHETGSVANMVRLLELCYERVTVVELASVAIQMLTSGKIKFDVIMANVNSPDLHGYNLVQHVVIMDIPVIRDDNAFMARKALESGAFLYIKKPATTELIGCLWQHVHAEKTRMMREREKLAALSQGIEFREPIYQDEGNFDKVANNEMFVMSDKEKSKKKFRARIDSFNRNDDPHGIDNNKLKRKVCTEWTDELHAKFLNAIEILGEGRCFPREILELMNVPGLTRMQVASHLQKCRNEKWKILEDKKAMNQAFGVGSSEKGASHAKPRKFGSMPKISKTMHQTDGVEISSHVRPDSDSGMHENMENQYVMENNNVHHQLLGSFQAGPSRLPSNGLNQSDEFFDIPGMDCLIQDFSVTSQGFVTDITSLNLGHPPDEAVLNAKQNSMVQSMDMTTRPCSSKTSSFVGDDSRGE